MRTRSRTHGAHRGLRRGGVSALSIAVFAAAFILASSGAAFGYWTLKVTSGQSSYSLADAESLVSPTSPTASADGSGQITVGWTPATEPSGATVQYQVTRVSGPGSPTVVCEVDATVDSCADSGLQPDTTYAYSIVAVYDLWQSSAVTTGTTTMTPTFEITLSPGPYAAGSAITVTQIEAVLGTTVDTTYAGPKTITWSGLTDSPGESAPSYPPASVTFSDGVANPSSTFTPYDAGSNTLVATDANSTSVTGSTTFSVDSGVASQIVLTPSLSSLVSGSAQAFTATIEDPLGNPVTGGTDSTDPITFSQTSTPPGSVTIGTPSPTLGGTATVAVTGAVIGQVTIQASGTVNGTLVESNSQSFAVTSSGPGTGVPEAPFAPLLPMLAFAVGGVGVFVARRRHA